MDETKFSYAAGYIDGDGCFYIGKIKKSPFYQDTFSIISTHQDAIEWFDHHFKGSIQAKTPKQKNRVPSFHFVFSKEGYEVLPKILPFLIEKPNECITFLEFRNASGDFKEERKKRSIDRMNYLKHWYGIIKYSIKQDIELVRNTVYPSVNDFAYLAGYIDAECSLDINKTIQKKGITPTYRAQIQCNNTKFPFFYWSSQRFGGQFHFLDKSHLRNCRNQILWRISNLQLDPILHGIYPFLVHKKPICEQMIKLRQKVLSKDFFGREEIYQKVRHLNGSII